MTRWAQGSRDRAESGTPRGTTADRSTAGVKVSVKAATFRGTRAGSTPACSPVPNAPHEPRRDSGVALDGVVGNSGGDE
jgi:hypothetical protein